MQTLSHKPVLNATPWTIFWVRGLNDHVSLRAYSGATAFFVVLQHVSHSLEVLMVIMHTSVTVDDTMN